MSALDTLDDQNRTHYLVVKELEDENAALTKELATTKAAMALLAEDSNKLDAILPLALSVAQDLICELRERHNWPDMHGASIRRYQRDTVDAEALLRLIPDHLLVPADVTVVIHE